MVALYTLSGVFAALAGIALVAYGGQPSLGLGDPYLFESIAAVVVGGVSILGGRGHYLGVIAGSLTLVAVVTFLRAQRVPEYGRSIIYGLVILAILFTYSRDKSNALVVGRRPITVLLGRHHSTDDQMRKGGD